MTFFTTPDGEPFFCGTYFPPTHVPAALQVSRDAWGERRDEVLGSGQRIVAALATRRRSRRRGRRGLAADARRGRARSLTTSTGKRRFRWGTEVPAVDGAGAAAASSRAHRRRRALRWSRRPATRWRAAGCTTSSLEASRATRSTPVGRAALREDALRQRPAGAGLRAPVAGDGPRWPGGSRSRPRTCSCASCARPRAASPRPSTLTPTASRGSPTSGHRRSWSRCSATTTVDGPRTCWPSQRAGPSKTARRPCSCAPTPMTVALGIGAGTAARGARRGPSRRATTRSSRPGTAWLSRPLPRPARCWTELISSPPRRRGRPARRAPRRRPAPAGVAGRCGRCAPGVLEDYADLAEGLLALVAVTGDVARLRRRASCSTSCWPASRTTTAVSSTPRTTPTRLRRYAAAGPDRQRHPVRPGGGRGGAADLRRVHRVDAPSRGGRRRRRLRPLAAGHARFAGWAWPSPRHSPGPREVAVVGAGRRLRSCYASRARVPPPAW